MKYYYICAAVMMTALFTLLGFGDYLENQKEMKKLENKKLELLIKLKQK